MESKLVKLENETLEQLIREYIKAYARLYFLLSPNGSQLDTYDQYAPFAMTHLRIPNVP